MAACDYHAYFFSSAASSVACSSLVLLSSPLFFVQQRWLSHLAAVGLFLTLEGISKCPRPHARKL